MTLPSSTTRLRAAALLMAVAVAPLRADLTYVMKTEAHASTVPAPPSTNPMLAMLGGIVVGTIVPPGGIRMTVIVGEHGTRIQYDSDYLGVPAGGAMLIGPDGASVIVNPATRTYWTAAKLDSGMIGLTLNPSVEMHATGERATIAGARADRSTFEVRVALPSPSGGGLPGLPPDLALSGEVWLSPLYARYVKLMPALAGGLALFGGDKIAASGFPMRSVLRGELFAGQEIESVVTSIAEATVPEAAFHVPPDYTETPPPGRLPSAMGR